MLKIFIKAMQRASPQHILSHFRDNYGVVVVSHEYQGRMYLKI